MTADVKFLSRYDLRVKLVQDLLDDDERLTDGDTRALAMRVLHAMDTIPEKVR